jgi:hypothetical protein
MKINLPKENTCGYYRFFSHVFSRGQEARVAWVGERGRLETSRR